MSNLDTLQASIEAVLGARVKRLVRDRGEMTITVRAPDYAACVLLLRDHAELGFEQLIDLCGVDYLSYKDSPGRANATASCRTCSRCATTGGCA